MCTYSFIDCVVLLDFEFGYYLKTDRNIRIRLQRWLYYFSQRLDQLEIARQAQLNAQHTQSLTDITWGSQIPSYVLHVVLRLYISPLPPFSGRL